MALQRFAAAAPEEEIVHGAAAPGGIGGTAADVDAWIAAVQDAGIQRVVCLLSEEQLRRYHGLLDAYRRAFGVDRVTHVHMADHRLAEPDELAAALAAFTAADEAGEPVVAHCLAGIGRTGHALAAWLVAARGYDPASAIETVRETGRQPAEAVRSGNAEMEELHALLEGVSSDV